MIKEQSPQERREFVRLDFIAPLAYKVCKKDTIRKLLEGYTSNISKSGVLCNVKDKVGMNEILWLAFDRGTLDICEDLEKRCFIYQNGVVGKVVRIEEQKDGSYNIGIQFVTREEQNDTHIFPKVHFITDLEAAKAEEDEDESEGPEPARDQEPLMGEEDVAEDR